MTRLIVSTCLLLLFCVFGHFGPALVGRAAVDPHAYFNAMIARADHWKSYSLRDPRQLDHPKNGGYAHSNSAALWVTYDPAGDTDPRRQDAAKIVIPDFIPSAALAQPVSPSDTTIVLTWTPTLNNGRAVRIGSEVMTVVRTSGQPIVNNTVTVNRAQHGTTAAAHAAGSQMWSSVNSLLNQVRVPMGTAPGHTYLVTWDAWFGSEFDFDRAGIDTFKTFQFASNGIWWEMQTRMGQAPGTPIGLVTTRSYARSWGPEITNPSQIPQVNSFAIAPERWTRYWALIDQTHSDYDRMSLWVADEQNDPVLLVDRAPFKSNNGTVEEFYLEYNTSTTTAKAGRGPIIAYARNIAMLRDVANPAGVMVRPNAGTPLPPPTTPAPRAPSNVRILTQ